MKYLALFTAFMLSINLLFAQEDNESEVNGFQMTKKPKVNTDASTAVNSDITFVLFDRAKADSFIQKYYPYDFNNNALKNEIKELLKIRFSDMQAPLKNELYSTTCTTVPTSKDMEIARVVLKAAIDTGSKFQKSNFNAAMNYLFFYRCLPADLQSKWVQELFGNYSFNELLISELRAQSFFFDELVTGSNQKELSDFDLIFGGHNFNEIESKEAANMKMLLATKKEFKDNSFLESKKIMFTLLDKVLNGEIRLFIVEWE